MQRNPDGTFEHQVTFSPSGQKWAESLPAFWADPKQTKESLVRRLGHSYSEICTQAIKMGLTSAPGLSLKKVGNQTAVNKWAGKNDHKLQLQQLLEIIHEHPGVRLGSLPTEAQKLYGCLILKEPDLVEHEIHPILITGARGPFTRSIDWKMQDDERIEKLKSEEKRIAAAVVTNIKQRITKTLLLQHARPYAKITAQWLPFMPQCAAWLDERVESDDQRVARLIVHANIRYCMEKRRLLLTTKIRLTGLWEIYYAERRFRHDIRVAVGKTCGMPTDLIHHFNALSRLVRISVPNWYLKLLGKDNVYPGSRLDAA